MHRIITVEKAHLKDPGVAYPLALAAKLVVSVGERGKVLGSAGLPMPNSVDQKKRGEKDPSHSTGRGVVWFDGPGQMEFSLGTRTWNGNSYVTKFSPEDRVPRKT